MKKQLLLVTVLALSTGSVLPMLPEEHKPAVLLTASASVAVDASSSSLGTKGEGEGSGGGERQKVKQGRLAGFIAAVTGGWGEAARVQVPVAKKEKKEDADLGEDLDGGKEDGEESGGEESSEDADSEEDDEEQASVRVQVWVQPVTRAGDYPAVFEEEGTEEISGYVLTGPQIQGHEEAAATRACRPLSATIRKLEQEKADAERETTDAVQEGREALSSLKTANAAVITKAKREAGDAVAQEKDSAIADLQRMLRAAQTTARTTVAEKGREIAQLTTEHGTALQRVKSEAEKLREGHQAALKTASETAKKEGENDARRAANVEIRKLKAAHETDVATRVRDVQAGVAASIRDAQAGIRQQADTALGKKDEEITAALSRVRDLEGQLRETYELREKAQGDDQEGGRESLVDFNSPD